MRHHDASAAQHRPAAAAVDDEGVVLRHQLRGDEAEAFEPQLERTSPLGCPSRAPTGAELEMTHWPPGSARYGSV